MDKWMGKGRFRMPNRAQSESIFHKTLMELHQSNKYMYSLENCIFITSWRCISSWYALFPKKKITISCVCSRANELCILHFLIYALCRTMYQFFPFLFFISFIMFYVCVCVLILSFTVVLVLWERFCPAFYVVSFYFLFSSNSQHNDLYSGLNVYRDYLSNVFSGERKCSK